MRVNFNVHVANQKLHRYIIFLAAGTFSSDVKRPWLYVLLCTDRDAVRIITPVRDSNIINNRYGSTQRAVIVVGACSPDRLARSDGRAGQSARRGLGRRFCTRNFRVQRTAEGENKNTSLSRASLDRVPRSEIVRD